MKKQKNKQTYCRWCGSYGSHKSSEHVYENEKPIILSENESKKNNKKKRL
jgi:ribosomal protein L44E